MNWHIRVLVMLGCFAAAGCLSSPTGNGNAPIVGTWAYAGLQTSPSTSTLAGTLTITTQQNGIFSGTLTVVETPSGGSPFTRSGVVSGQSLSSTGVQFDVLLDNDGSDAVARTHLGTITGDSLVGAWAEEVSGGPAGTFRAHRVSIP